MQSKYLPLRYAPIEIELSLSDATEPVVSEQLGNFTTANTSFLYNIENCMFKCDVCTLDNALDNTYVSHLLSGRSLNIVYNTFISNIQTILSNDSQVNVSRSVSKLKSIFLSLEKDFVAGSDRKKFSSRHWNNLYSPMAVDTNTAYTTHREAFEIENIQFQVGAFLMPQYPIRSHAECYYSLKKSSGIAANSLHGIDMDGNESRNDKFIVCIDCEK